MQLLHLDAGITGQASVTRALSRRIVDRLAAAHPDAVVVDRDLVAAPLPHLTPATLPAAHPGAGLAGQLDAAGEQARAASDAVLAEFVAADVVVIGAPMYNFTVPTQLKAWIDRVLVPGTTFRYAAGGAEGLMGGKRVIVALARGGYYGEGAAHASAEHAERYLRTVFGFIGIAEVEFVVAEGLSRGEQDRAAAIGAAEEAVGQLAA